MNHESLISLHALATIPQLGSRRLRLLIDRCGSPEAVWSASLDMWLEAGFGKNVTEKIWNERQFVVPEAAWESLEKHSIIPIAEDDEHYPPSLREIPDPPIIIYTRGTLPEWPAQPIITIVGTRKPSSYGAQVVERLVAELVSAGIIIVSGLAYGIDALAHRATLAAGGITIAVLGNGLDGNSIAPHTHLPLAQSIVAAGGLLLSEYSPYVEASKGTFPARNRIMAGLSIGTLVIEAAEKSGSLITARHALEFNREVFAVPGPIFAPLSAGPNNLLRRGAKVVTGIQDILEELRPNAYSQPRQASLFSGDSHHHQGEKPLPIHLPPDEQHLLKYLDTTPCHIDKLAKLATLEPTRLSAALTMLEIKGLAKNTGAMHYIRSC